MVDKRTRDMHTKRLLKLADILAKFRPTKGKTFNMGEWGRHDMSHHPEKEANFCGTAACALGHAAMDKNFRRAGLEMEWEASFYNNDGDYCGEPQAYQATIMFKGEENESAGAKFFGLSYDEACDIFLGTDATKKEVIAKLKKYAKRRKELMAEAEAREYEDQFERGEW